MTEPPATPDAASTWEVEDLPFAQIPHALIEDLELPHTAVRVYCYLVRRARNDTKEAFPGYRRISKEIGMSIATVKKGIEALEDRGWIDVTRSRTATGRRETNHYFVRRFPGGVLENSTGVPKSGTGGVPENSTELDEVLTTPKELVARPRNPIWDSLVELFGEPAPNRTSIYGRVTKYLQNQDATPDEIQRRAARIVTDWGPEKLTLTSLETHWSRFDGAAGQITERDVRRFQRSTVEATTYPDDHPAAIAKRRAAQ